MRQELKDQQSIDEVQCIVWGRVVGYPSLLKRIEASYPTDSQKKLDDEFVQFYERAKAKTGISPSGFKHTLGSGFAIVGSADEVDLLSQALLDLLAETNAQFSDQREHRRLAIGATEWRAPESEDARSESERVQAYRDASELANKADAFEIRISAAIYRALPDGRRRQYSLIDEQTSSREAGEGATSWSRLCGCTEPAVRCVMRVDMAGSNGIRKKLAIAMKSEGASTEVQNQIADIVSEGFNRVEEGSYNRCQIDFGGDGGLFLLPNPTQAHKVAMEILKRADEFSEEARNANIELGMRCFRIGIDVGNLTLDNAGEYDGQALANATRLEEGGPTGEIRISETAYRLLPEEIRRLYGDKELIRGKEKDVRDIPGRRFDAAKRAPWPEVEEKSGKPFPPVKRPNTDFETQPGPKLQPCFVICPFNDSDRRSDAIFTELIKPACEQLGMIAERADHFPGDRKQLIKEKLKSASIVIAYLGTADEHLNGNVVLEVGYRLATGKPLVMICDAKKDGGTPDYQSILPIQLNSDNIITAGPDPKTKIGALCAEINAVKGRKHADEWESPYPIVMYRFTNPNTDVELEESNAAARQLFGEDAVQLECGIQKMRELIAERVDVAQRDARMAEFMDMFPKLIAFSMMQNSGSQIGKEIAISRIPLVFKNSPVDPRTRKPRGYLPIVSRWSYEAGVCRIRYMYLPVSDAMRMDPDHGYYVCDL